MGYDDAILVQWLLESTSWTYADRNMSEIRKLDPVIPLNDLKPTILD